ncbi:Repeat domain-containing protein [Senna tora]|uniref:Repeat domain-containing protein n=1 Tax=Senna tora TaxID=362788 RepID=A0A834SDR7_9FABA|nr:Repeat domain-containing protein [Senna tora]
MGGVWIMSEHIPDKKSRSYLRNLHELRGKRLVAKVSETRRFALYLRTGVVLMLQLESSWHGRSVDHVLTYSGRQIAVGSQKPSRITRQKTCCASESNTSVRVVFANPSGFNAPIGDVLAWEECGSCLNIFQMKNRGRISETFTNYEAKDLLRKSVDPVLTYFGRQIAVVSQKLSGITRQNTCCASESNTSVRVVFANGSGFDAPIGVVLAWEERGSCLNIFRTTNRGRVSETFTNYEAKDLLRKNLHELRGKRLVAQVSQITSVRVVFANRSGFDVPIGVVLAWEERGSCLNIFRTTNRCRVSETLMNYEAKGFLHNESNTSVRVVLANRSGFDAPIGVVLAWEERRSCLNISGLQIAVVSLKPSRIMRQKICCASESNTSVRVEFANPSGFDAPIGVVLALEERGSYPDILRMTNHGESNTSVRVVFANRSGFDAPIGVVLAWEERGSLKHVVFANRSGFIAPIGVVLAWEELGSRLNIFWIKNRGRSQKPSQITRQKTCCGSELNTSVRVVFANRSGFDAPIGVVLAWEECGSCLNIPDYKSRSGLRNLHEL